MSFVYLLVNTPDTPENTKMLASLIPQVAMYLLSVPFAGYESVGIGLTMNNVDMMFENYRVNGGLNMLLLDLIIYSLIGIYLDNILPRSYG
jgi:ATP-binding cassette subfamily A (ABC1) protein 3